LKNLIVGIDPGKNTAIAFYDKQLKKIIDVRSTDFWGCYQIFVGHNEEAELLSLDNPIKKVIIEVPRTKKNWHKEGCDITSANVGMIYDQSHLLAEGIERLGYKVLRQHPQGKVDAAYIKKLTGWKKRTSQHARDAIMLCWGF